MGKHTRKPAPNQPLTAKQKKALTKEELAEYEKMRALIQKADEVERAYNVRPQAAREAEAAKTEHKKRWWQR